MAWLISKTKDGPAVAFYHLPKTGGLFVEESCRAARLSVVGLKSKSNVHNRHAPPMFVTDARLSRAVHSFVVVRNPFAWYESWWRYKNGHGRGRDVGPEFWYVFENCPDPSNVPFDSWLHEMLMFEPALMTRAIEWYAGPISSLARRTDFSVLKLEDFPYVLIDLLSNHLDLHVDMKRMIQRHRVVNNSQNAAAVWSPKHREAIRDLEEPILRTWYR